jgi:hypothetical protein
MTAMNVATVFFLLLTSYVLTSLLFPELFE